MFDFLPPWVRPGASMALVLALIGIGLIIVAFVSLQAVSKLVSA